MASKNVLVRILQAIRIHATEYCCNDVVSMPIALAAVHEKSGSVDTDPDAVAFAREKLGSVPKDHVVPDEPKLVAGAAASAAGTADGAAATVSAQGTTDGQADAQGQAASSDLLTPVTPQ
jgi:hypothetical protein